MKKKKVTLYIAILILWIIVCISIYRLTSVYKVISSDGLRIINIIILGIAVITLLAIVKIYNKKSLKPEKAFLYVVPIFCVLLSLAIPAGRGHDEYVHWLRTYEISEGTLVTTIEGNQAIVKISKNASQILLEKPQGYFKYLYNAPLLNVKIDESQTEEFPNPNAAVYCFVQYLPQATGVAIGRLFTQNPLLLVYIARFSNMVVCLILMYFSIKLIPFGKNILFVLSIIPIIVEGFSTLSSDGITISVSCLYLSYILNIIFNENKKCGIKETVILTIIGAILSLCKIVYLPLLFLVLLIPKDKFKSRKNQIVSISIILMVGVILNLSWLYYASHALMSTSVSASLPEDRVVSNKLFVLLSNPIRYLQKVFYTFGLNAHDYFISLFGGYLEWNEDVKIEVIPYILAVITFLATITDQKLKGAFRVYQKVIMLFIIFAVIGLIFTSLYLQFASLKFSYINGVQGRYFLPILPLILFMIAKIKIKTEYTELQITKLICICSLIIQIYTIAFVMAIHI